MSFRGGGGFNNSGGGGNFNNRGSGGGGNFNRGGGGGGNFNRGGGGGAPRGGYGDGQIQGGDEFTNLLSNLMNAPPAESGKVLPFPVKNDSGSSVSNSSRVAADPYPRNSATASGSTDSRGAADPYPRNSATASGSTDSRGAADPYPRNSATASGPTDSRGASNWIPAPSRAEYQNAAPAPAVQQIPENRDIFEDQAPAVPKPYLYSRSEMLAHQPSENACPPSRDEFHDNGSNYDTLFPSSRPEVPIQQPPPVKLDDANSQGSAVPAPYRCVRFAPTVDPLSTSSHLMPQANIDTKPVEIPAEVKHSPTVEDSHNENDSQSSASDFVDHYAAYREVSRDGIYTNLLEVPADLEYSPLMIAVVKEIESLSPVLNAVKQSVSPTINAIYLVKKPGHETYARAKVLHVKGDRVSVFFIDFIVSGVVDVKHVKIFPNVSTWKMYPDHM